MMIEKIDFMKRTDFVNRVSPREIVYKKKCPDHRGNERLFSEKYLLEEASIA